MSCARIAVQRLLQVMVFVLLVRPFLAVFMGLAARHRRHLPCNGPAIIIANHNSHLDTLAILSQLPLRTLWHVRPAAAADHFGRGLAGWLARTVLRVVLIERHGRGIAALDPLLDLLDQGEIVLFFPEGSRGEPEVMGPFRQGVAHLARARPAAPLVPVYLHNMGKCMPRGGWLFVPFNCEMIVGEPVDLCGMQGKDIPGHLREVIEALARQTALARWDAQEGHGLGDPPHATAADPVNGADQGRLLPLRQEEPWA